MPAIIGEQGGVTQLYRPRLSTPEPATVDRWDDTGPDFSALLATPDFSPLIEYTPGSYSQAPTAGPLSLGLSLGLAKADDWGDAYAPQPEYTSSNATAVGAKFSASNAGGRPGARSGGMGLGAYGWQGNSGVAGTKGASPYGLQSPFWQALGAANAALKAAGLGTFGITDGWRSYDAQVDVKKRKPNLAATPGRSVHGIGLAADLRLSSAQLKWLKANGAKYGLINLPSESWHWQLDPGQWTGF